MAGFAVILPAAGQSRRFGSDETRRKKTFVELQGRPVWVRSVTPFANHPAVKQLIVVVAPDDLDWFKDKYRAHLAFMDIRVVAGGAERAESVRHGLAAVGATVEFVAVHDAARPLIQRSQIDAVFAAAEQHGAAILATRVANTLKRVAEDGRILETVSRESLWAAQTPQVARRDWLLAAYESPPAGATDEAQLLEAAGRPVFVVEGEPTNLKITTAHDLDLASAILDSRPDTSARPLHPFADEEP